MSENEQATSQPKRPVVMLMVGMAGSGKTTLMQVRSIGYLVV